MAMGFRVRVPASSANLGAAFDSVAVALGVYLDIDVGDDADAAPESHPGVRAFRHAGGSGAISVQAQFPGGRGLGFSGAARVGGVLAARIQQGESVHDARDAVLAAASEMEGHADNAAASLLGGVVAVAGGHAVRIPLATELAIVVWIPDRETSTVSARRLLPESVPFADATFNVGRTALLVAALAAGDVAALRTATEDHLHQDRRLARVPDTHHAMRAALDAGAYAAWLSGSGPSAAAFAEPSRAAAIAAALPPGGRAAVLSIDDVGASLIARGES
jgi:homoserine kinase